MFLHHAQLRFAPGHHVLATVLLLAVSLSKWHIAHLEILSDNVLCVLADRGETSNKFLATSCTHCVSKQVPKFECCMY